MHTRNNNPTTRALSACLAPGVHPWFLAAARSYIETVTRDATTEEACAAALDVGRETWRTWRAKLQEHAKNEKRSKGA